MNRIIAIYMLLIPLLICVCSSAKAFESDFDSGITNASISLVTADLNKDLPQLDLDSAGYGIVIATQVGEIQFNLPVYEADLKSQYHYSFISRAPPTSRLVLSI